MKKFLLVSILAVVGLVLLGGEPVFAGGSHFKKYVNDDSKEKNRVEAGIGGDVALWKHKDFQVDQETKFDLNSGDGTWEKGNLATYTVVTPNTGDKGLLQIIGDKIKSIVSKD